MARGNPLAPWQRLRHVHLEICRTSELQRIDTNLQNYKRPSPDILSEPDVQDFDEIDSREDDPCRMVDSAQLGDVCADGAAELHLGEIQIEKQTVQGLSQTADDVAGGDDSWTFLSFRDGVVAHSQLHMFVLQGCLVSRSSDVTCNICRSTTSTSQRQWAFLRNKTLMNVQQPGLTFTNNHGGCSPFWNHLKEAINTAHTRTCKDSPLQRPVGNRLLVDREYQFQHFRCDHHFGSKDSGDHSRDRIWLVSVYSNFNNHDAVEDTKNMTMTTSGGQYTPVALAFTSRPLQPWCHHLRVHAQQEQGVPSAHEA